MACTTQVPIALKIKASCVFSLFLRRYSIKLGARLHLSWGRRRLAAIKNPGQSNWPGLMAGVMPMPSGFARESVIVSQCGGNK